MSETRRIDLRNLPPQMRHGVVFQAFDALTKGEALVLVNDHDPMPLLQQFKFLRPGESEHDYLERGPVAWEVRITRKATARAPSAGPDRRSGSPAAAGALRETEHCVTCASDLDRGVMFEPSSVTEYLEADHRRLDALLPEVERLAVAGAHREAAAKLAEFSSGLGRHIDVEEELLFPTFERATGITSGPTRVMRAEHDEIREWMRVASECIARDDAMGLHEAIASLTRTLAEHNRKEEHVLYPMTDQAMGTDERRRELVSQMQAY